VYKRQVVSAFTLPATSTSLTIPVSSFTATDNVGVSGYQITSSAVAPTVWSATKPTTVTAAAAGSVTFYAWAKDAAGNVSLSKSAAVVITLFVTPDNSGVPVVTAFTLPSTATKLTVPVTSFTATDNLRVTGYKITRSPTTPLASASGWSAIKPSYVTSPTAGSVTFYAWAKDAAGNVSLSKHSTVLFDLTPPALAISCLGTGSSTSNATLNVSGRASDANGLKSVTVNGEVVAISPEGIFSSAVALNVGYNSIKVIATDKVGKYRVISRTVKYVPAAPLLTVITPADNSMTSKSFVTVSGNVEAHSRVTVKTNNSTSQYATINDNAYSASAYLVPGINTIITTVNRAGKINKAKRTIIYDNNSPTLAITNPAQDITTTQAGLLLTGSITDALSDVTVSIAMDGQSYTPEVVNSTFQQSLTFTEAKMYAIFVTISDAVGNSSSVQRNVIYQPLTSGEHNDDDDDDDDDDDGGDDD
jgi:hypothetical protein